MSSALGKLSGSRELQGDDAEEASRGELQAVIAAVKRADWGIALKFGNFR